MSLQDKLDEYKAQFESSLPPAALAIMHRATDDLRHPGIMERVLKIGDLIQSAILVLKCSFRLVLISNEMDGKIYFVEIDCFNPAFASRLHDKIKPIVGRPMREVGELDL